MIANSDDSYNKKSHYGTFCGVSASRAKEELPDYFNKGDDVARTILNNLKGKISGEEGNYDDNCSAFINVVSETLDIKEVYSISEILNVYLKYTRNIFLHTIYYRGSSSIGDGRRYSDFE